MRSRVQCRFSNAKKVTYALIQNGNRYKNDNGVDTFVSIDEEGLDGEVWKRVQPEPETSVQEEIDDHADNLSDTSEESDDEIIPPSNQQKTAPVNCFKHAHVNKSYIQSRFLDRQHVDPAENCGYRGRNGPNSEKQGNIWPFGFVES